MTKILHNSTRYLEPYIVEKCFSKGKVTHVDKQVCGNGFSTAFFKTISAPGCINILIAPNKAFVIDKEKQYADGVLETGNRIKFFYAESKEVNFYDADLLVFVADSFLAMDHKIKEIAFIVDKVLIDEYHSTEIQSLYRYNLVDFTNKVGKLLPFPITAITTVTASPNLYSKVDICIYNVSIKPITINVSKDRENTVQRIKNDIKNKSDTVVFTNSPTAIYKIFQEKNKSRKSKVIPARFIIGDSLKESICELIEIHSKEDSNLTIVSSRGFEGFDIDYKNANIYFLEDRSTAYECFYLSNLYQAINRVRSGAAYIEYNRIDVNERLNLPFIDIDKEVNDFLKMPMSNAKRQKTEYKKYRAFIIFENEKGNFTARRNEVSISLYKEKLLFDLPRVSQEFQKFLDDRLITLNYINENPKRLQKKVKNTTKVSNLLLNKKYIKENNLFGNEYTIPIVDLKPNSKIHDNRVHYLKHLEDYLRRKNYSGNRVVPERQQIALSILKDSNKFHSLVRDVVKTYDLRSIEKYGVAKSAEYRKEFRDTSYNVVCKWILTLANDRIAVPSNWIAHRDYNISVLIGVKEIELLCDVFNISVKEIDIRNCFPRVLHAINDLHLPTNFYGVNKKNKVPVNIAINDFWFDKNKGEKKFQKQNAKRRFERLGFIPKVTEYLLTNHFDNVFKDDIFTFLSYHEKNIISTIKDQLKDLDNDGVIRRHDSVLVFNNKSDLTFLNDFKYLDVGDWFEIKEIPVIELECRKLLSDDMKDFDLFVKELERDAVFRKMSKTVV